MKSTSSKIKRNLKFYKNLIDSKDVRKHQKIKLMYLIKENTYSLSYAIVLRTLDNLHINLKYLYDEIILSL